MTRVLIEVFRVIVLVGAAASVLLVMRGVSDLAQASTLDLRAMTAAGSLLWGLSGLASTGFAATVLHIADRLDQIADRQTKPNEAAPPPTTRIEPRLKG